MKRYRFIKKFESYEGIIPEGSDITIMENGAIYFNSGLLHSAYRKVISEMLKNDRIRNEYLVEESIPYNKV